MIILTKYVLYRETSYSLGENGQNYFAVSNLCFTKNMQMRQKQEPPTKGGTSPIPPSLYKRPIIPFNL